MKFFGWIVLAASAAASPLRFRPAFEKRADITVTTANIETMYFYAQYAGAAYCNSEVDVGTAIACDNYVCPDVEADNATVVATLSTGSLASEITDTQGFVATDDVANLLVVSFQGSSSVENWLADLDFVLVDCSSHLTDGLADSIGSDCKVHDGFGASWESLRTTTLAAVASYQGDRAVVVTGHSLGAAVATLAAAELRYAGVQCELYTYGSPRVGNEALVEYLSSQTVTGGSTGAASGINNHRLTHTDDPVPQLPPRSISYRHTSPEYWLDAGTLVESTDTVTYVPSDISICTGYANGSCNAGTDSLTDFAAHRLYFMHISSC